MIMTMDGQLRFFGMHQEKIHLERMKLNNKEKTNINTEKKQT